MADETAVDPLEALEPGDLMAAAVWRAALGRLGETWAGSTAGQSAAAFRLFHLWCEAQGLRALPAADEVVAAFVDAHATRYSPRTMTRLLCGVRRVHLSFGLTSPTHGAALRLARLRHLRSPSRRRRRRLDAPRGTLERLLAACPSDLLGLRDQAMLHLAFDTLCRRRELCLFRVEELEAQTDGTARVALRRRCGANDVIVGHAFLSRGGARTVRAWIEAAGLTAGPLLRRLDHGRLQSGGVGAHSVDARLRILADRADLAIGPEQRGLTIHSLRVGAAQSLAATGLTIAQVMRAGRWARLELPVDYLREAADNLWENPDGDACGYYIAASRQRRVETAMRRRAAVTPQVEPSAGENQAIAEPPSAATPARPAPDAPPLDWRAAIALTEGAYAPATVTMLRRHLADFERCCAARGEIMLPASSATVAAYVGFRSTQCGPGAIAQKLHAIRLLHRIAGATDSTRADEVVLARRRGRRPHSPRQALGVTRALRERLLGACGQGLIGLRDRVLVNLGCDTLCRGAELTALRIEDLVPEADGGARLLLRRSKSDRFGRGEWAYVSPEGLAATTAWLQASGLTQGWLLPRMPGGRIAAGPLSREGVSTRLRVLARAAGLAEDEIARLSSHSFRVGGAQELAAAGRSLVEIMRAGRWTSPKAVAVYLRCLEINPWRAQDATDRRREALDLRR